MSVLDLENTPLTHIYMFEESTLGLLCDTPPDLQTTARSSVIFILPVGIPDGPGHVRPDHLCNSVNQLPQQKAYEGTIQVCEVHESRPHTHCS